MKIDPSSTRPASFPVARYGRAATLLPLAVMLLVTGCMVGPDYQRPDTVVSPDSHAAYAFTDGGIAAAEDPNGVVRWWQQFGDPVTDDLVTQALANNTDIRAAAAAVLAAEAQYREAHGARLPTLDYRLSGTRSRTVGAGPQGWDHTYNTLFEHGLSVGYAADLFGRLRRTEQAAWRDLLATAAHRQAVVHAVIAAVVNARVDVAIAQRLRNIAAATTASYEKTLEIAERRYRQGLIEPVEVRLARENVAAARVNEVRAEQALMQARLRLDVLVHQSPGRSAALGDTLTDLPSLQAIPAGVPAALLDRRPDLRSAELRLMAATERVAASVAALYPDLTLTGSAGFRSDELARLLSHEYLVYSAVASLAAPIFRGGQLRARVDASEAALEQAAANYAGLVIRALQEVEDALLREQYLREMISRQQERLTEAQAAEDLARERYRSGVGALLLVLETERRRQLAENDLAATKGNLWRARVDLHLALGGHWLEAPPADAAVAARWR